MKKMRLWTAVFAVAAAAALFAACGSGSTAPETEEEPGPSAVSATETETVPEPAEAALSSAPTERSAADLLAEAGVIEDNSYVQLPMDAAAVLKKYTEAVNEVKLRCPGFVRTEIQSVEDVTAGKGRLQFANQLVNLVAVELLRNGGDGSTVITVPAHNDVQVREKFPVYGQDYGCGLTDVSLIGSAACYTNGEKDRIVITLEPALNPEPRTSAFGSIMTPIERKNVTGGIAKLFYALAQDRYTLDFNYTDNEIVCELDRQTGRVSSLTMRMVVRVDFDMDLDLLLLRADFAEAHGCVVHKVMFTDFDWE